ncbi:MAG: hypothetical protein H0T17_10070 [Propionibacteriales bacterium]|nr:hypothetical protein [Propionibacteriales bacterium]
MSRTRNTINQFIRNPNTGRVVIVQPPNIAILTWLAARGGVLLWDDRAQELRWVGSGALMVWALAELTRGQSPFRRTLGAAVLAYELVSLSR